MQSSCFFLQSICCTTFQGTNEGTSSWLYIRGPFKDRDREVEFQFTLSPYLKKHLNIEIMADIDFLQRPSFFLSIIY